jgi:hypothetical protein
MNFIYHFILASDWLVKVDILTLFMFTLLFSRLTGQERLVGIILLFYALSDIIAAMIGMHGFNNLWFYNLMLIPQFILVVYCLTKEFSNVQLKINLRWICVLILILHVLDIFFIQGFHELCDTTYILAGAFMAVTAYFYLQEQFEYSETPPFLKFITWFAFATLIDYAGTMPIAASLSWPGLYSESTTYFLLDFNQGVYISWFLINITGLLWTKTTLRSVLRLR